MKKALKILLCTVCLIVLAAAGFILYLTVTEFKPAPVEELAISSDPD